MPQPLTAVLTGAAIGLVWGFSSSGIPTDAETLLGGVIGYSFIPGVIGWCIGKRLKGSPAQARAS